MNILMKKIETIFAAAAFAEAGEFETARQILNEENRRKSDRPSIRDAHRSAVRH